MKPAKLLKLSEADIERTCSDYLALDGWRGLKTNPVSNKARGAGFGELGMADHLYIRYSALGGLKNGRDNRYDSMAQVLWIEWKSKTGKAEDHQVIWHGAERARGALVLLAGVDFPATIGGFLEWYRTSGLNRGKV